MSRLPWAAMFHRFCVEEALWRMFVGGGWGVRVRRDDAGDRRLYNISGGLVARISGGLGASKCQRDLDSETLGKE